MKKVEEEFFIGQMAVINREFTLDFVEQSLHVISNYNQIFEKALRMKDGLPIAPWFLAEGLVIELLYEEFSGYQLLMMQKELLYLELVYIGDTITAEIEVIDINEKRKWLTAKVLCRNERENVVIKGQIVLQIQ